MSELQSTVPALLESTDSRATANRFAPAALQTCLVVSASARRAQLLVRAAHEERWATIVCTSAADALRQAVLKNVQLALVDLQSAPESEEPRLRKLVEQLATRRLLLAVCGRPNDTTGEVWSRQLGVWMYLPGVNSQSDIALLCAEARNVLEKLAGRAAQRIT